MSVKDGKPYITIKNGRIARSGIQYYTKEEILARGLVPKTDKPVYAEMRPANVVIKAKDLYRYVPFVNEHTDYDVTPDNYREHMIGMTGGNIGVEVIDGSDDIFLTSEVIFYDRQAHKDYEAGKKELSSSYDAESVAVDFDEYGYDFLLQEMPSVNHLALCKMARAGHAARILDSVRPDAENLGNVEETPMKALKGVLAVLGFGKSKDSVKPFSASVFDSLEKAKTLDDENRNKARDSFVDESIFGSLIDCDARSMLAGLVSDSFDAVADVLAGDKEELGKVVDSLHGKCIDAMKSVLDEEPPKKDGDGKKPAKKEGEEDEDDDDKSKKSAKDSADDIGLLVSAAIAKALPDAIAKVTKAVNDGIDASVDASVTKALGLEPSGKGVKLDQRPVRDSVADFDVEGLFDVNAR